MITSGGTTTLGLYDFKIGIEQFGQTGYWVQKANGYPINKRIMLDNGDIVKSTIDENANDPNTDLTGWVKVNSASQIFDESGKNQQEINTNLGYWDGGLKSYIKFITYEALGAKFDGVTDDTLAIQRGNNLTLSGYNVRAATNGGRARITSKVTFYAVVGHTDLGNCYLVPDTTVMTSGYAARIMGDINKTYNDGSRLTINLLGPYGEHGSVIPLSPTTTLRGLEINPGTNTQVSNVDLYIKVQGFYENVYIGQKSVYLLRFHSPMVGRSWYRNWTFDCVADAGENISIFGGCSFNCRNADRTAVDMTVTTEGHFIDLYLYGVSQDYNDIDFDIKSGIVTKIGGHNENNSLKPYAKLSYTTGKRHPTLNLIGVYFDGGNDRTQDAGNTGKPILFDVGAGTSIVIKGGTIGKYGKMQGVKIFGGLENAAHLVKMSGVYFDIQNDVDMIDWGINNPLRNRDYSLGNINFWQNTSTASGTPNTPTVTVESSPFGGVGMRVNCATNTGDTTTNIVQRLPCKSGELIYMFAKLGWKNINAISGNGYAQCIFYDAFGNLLERSSVGTNLAGKTGDSSEWVNCSRIVRVPSGAYFVDVGLRHYQISGDVWFGSLDVFIQ